MRYRPFTSNGLSSSAITLSLREGQSADHCDSLVCAALECGVNSFSFAAGDEGAAQALRRAVAIAGRRVLILMLRVDPQGPAFQHQARAAVAASGATVLDAAILDQPEPGLLKGVRRGELDSLRADRLSTRLGFAAEGAAAEQLVAGFDFDVMATRYSVASGWPERNLLKMAAKRGMTVLGYGHHVSGTPSRAAPIVRGLSRLLRRPEAAALPEDVYGFLNHTPDWAGEQLTLAYALTEPGLASILVEADDPAMLEGLAQAVERELPAGAAAQIEIARFSTVARRGAA